MKSIPSFLLWCLFRFATPSLNVHKLFRLILPLLCVLVCMPARAELLGTVLGRGANLQDQASLSIDVGASWYTQQLQWLTSRISVKPSHGFLMYFDYAQLKATNLPTGLSRLANFSGAGFGAGLLFHVPDVFFYRYDIAFKAAYHSAVVQGATMSAFAFTSAATRPAQPLRADLQQSQWSTEFVLSPIDPLYENGLSWYSTFGYVATSASTDWHVAEPLSAVTKIKYQDKNGVALGIGATKPIKRAWIYAGLEWLSGDPLVGAGVRLSLH